MKKLHKERYENCNISNIFLASRKILIYIRQIDNEGYKILFDNGFVEDNQMKFSCEMRDPRNEYHMQLEYKEIL